MSYKDKEKQKEYQKQWYQENKKELKEHRKQWNQENKRYKKQYREENKEKIKKYNKQYREGRKEETRQYNKQYRQDNKEKRREYERHKYKTNSKFYLSMNVSSLIRSSLKGNKNRSHWEDIVGFTLSDLIQHLETTSEFTIQDYLEKDLHIDHIIPVNLYNFETFEDEEFKKCWNLRNLRLVAVEENLSKGSKLDMELIEEYGIVNLLPGK